MGKWDGREVTIRTFTPKSEEHQKVGVWGDAKLDRPAVLML